MHKYGQKTTVKDPELAELKQFKADWNQKTKDFINNLINFKKLINGKTSKFHTYNEKANLKDPIPADPTKLLSDLTSQFEYLATNGNKFIQKQKSFSEHVKQRKQIKKSDVNYQLTSEASNIISRFFSKLKGMDPLSDSDFSTFENNKRLAILNKYAELEKILLNFKRKILESSEVEMKESDSAKLNRSLYVINTNKKQKPYAFNDDVKHINAILTSISVLLQDYSKRKKNIFEEEKSLEKEEKNIENTMSKFEETLDVSKVEKIENIVDDYENNKVFLSEQIPPEFKNNLSKLIDLLTEFLSSDKKVSNSNKNKLMERIIRVYDQIIDKLNKKYKTQHTSLSDFVDTIRMPEITAMAAFESPVTKFKEYFNKLNIFDSNAFEKKSIVESINSMRKNIQETMNLLEEYLEEDQIADSVSQLFNELESINYNLMSMGLSSSYIDNSFNRYKDRVNYFGRSSRIDYLPEKEQEQVIKKLKQKLLNRGL